MAVIAAQLSSILALKKLKACPPWDGALVGGVGGAAKRSLGSGCGGAINAAWCSGLAKKLGGCAAGAWPYAAPPDPDSSGGGGGCGGAGGVDCGGPVPRSCILLLLDSGGNMTPAPGTDGGQASG